ncbi:MAG: hypothetical protein ABSA85_03095 [Terracidiphilus sp.]
MSTTGFPAPGSGAGITSQIAMHRATPVVVENSRLLIAVTMICSILSAFFAVCMVLMVFSVLSSGGFSGGNLYNAMWWSFGAFAFGYGCPWMWKLSRAMAGYRVTMDGRGVMFNLGTKKQPSDLFLAWDQIAAIWHKRVGNAQQYYVQGRDGSEARFSSYTFFRPKKVARLIAERTGLPIQEA